MNTLITLTDAGLYCALGDFYIDPWRPVDRAVVTHAHGDHIVWGCRAYLVSEEGRHVARTRLGERASIQTAAYGEVVRFGEVAVSLHPAGHILGSSQVRVEHRGEVWVVTGDYKVEPDRTCTPFELVRCHTFVTESTFGLPIYRWQPQTHVFDTINTWWQSNAVQGKASLLYGYALGKAQRLIANVDPHIGRIYTHGAVERINRDYRASGVALPPTHYVGSAGRVDYAGALIIAPTSARSTPWTRRFGVTSTGFASGWMRIRGARRQRAVDRGFVLSDHVDWDGLLATITATGAEQVWVTHGYTAVVTRWLTEHGIDARIVPTRFSDERNDAGDAEADADTLADAPEPAADVETQTDMTGDRQTGEG